MGNSNPLPDHTGGQQSSVVGNKQDHAVIAEKTTKAIATQVKPIISTKNGASASNGTKPADQKKPPPDRKPIDSRDFSERRCLMFFPTSGHMGFEIVKTSDELPPVEAIREMIAYETRLRLSEPVQDLIDTYHTDEAAVTYILNLIQQHVVEYFGYHDVNALRTALHRFPDEYAVKEAFYVKYNRVTQGLVNEGQCARDVDLFTLDGHPTTLFSQISAGQPLVVLAGSTS